MLSSPYPESKIIGICKDPDNLQVMASLLLAQSEDLVITVINFMSTYIASGPEIDFKLNGTIDFLVSILDGPAGKEAFMLLYKLESVANKDYNADLDLSALEEMDRAVVEEDKNVKGSIFLRYLPVLFTKVIAKEPDAEKLHKIFTADQYRQPELIWTKEMRSDLIKEIHTHLSPYSAKVAAFANVQSCKTAESFPKYEACYKKMMVYPQLGSEIRSGGYYLNTYDEKSPVETVDQNALVESVEKNFADISKDLEHVDLAKIDVLLSSLKRGMETATKKVDMTPIMTVLVQVASMMSDKLAEGNNKLYLKNIGKFMTKSTKSGTALTTLEEEYCHSLSVSVLKKWFAHLKESKSETLEFDDVNGVRWFLALLYELVEKSSWSLVEKSERRVILLELFNFIYLCMEWK